MKEETPATGFGFLFRHRMSRPYIQVLRIRRIGFLAMEEIHGHSDSHREEALRVLKEYNANPALLSHALAVEAVMRYIARKRGHATEEACGGIAGSSTISTTSAIPTSLEMTGIILREHGFRRDRAGGGVPRRGLCSDVEPLTDMEKTLYAIDELSGLAGACALVRLRGASWTWRSVR